MLLNEVMHTIKACMEYRFTTKVAGRRICHLILFHRENGFTDDEPIIMLHTGMKVTDYPKLTIRVFYKLVSKFGSGYYHSPYDDSIFLIGSEQETKAIMKSWEFLNEAYEKFQGRNRKLEDDTVFIADTFHVFIQDIKQFPKMRKETNRIRRVLISNQFDLPPTRVIEYNKTETIIDTVPSDVREGCTVDFCYYKKITPQKKNVSFGSIYHQDNTYHVPVVARGVVFRKGNQLMVNDEDNKNYSLNRKWNRIYIRDVFE